MEEELPWLRPLVAPSAARSPPTPEAARRRALAAEARQLSSAASRRGIDPSSSDFGSTPSVRRMSMRALVGVGLLRPLDVLLEHRVAVESSSTRQWRARNGVMSIGATVTRPASATPTRDPSRAGGRSSGAARTRSRECRPAVSPSSTARAHDRRERAGRSNSSGGELTPWVLEVDRLTDLVEHVEPRRHADGEPCSVRSRRANAVQRRHRRARRGPRAPPRRPASSRSSSSSRTRDRSSAAAFSVKVIAAIVAHVDARLDEGADPVDEHRRLARACTRLDEQRVVRDRIATLLADRLIARQPAVSSLIVDLCRRRPACSARGTA